MTVKIARTGSPTSIITAAATPNKGIAAGEDFCIGFAIVMNGATSGVGGQYQSMVRTSSNGLGSVFCGWSPLDSGTSYQGKFYFQFATSTISCTAGPVEANGQYILVLQRNAGVITSKLCPVLSVQPVDGSAVLSSVSINNGNAMPIDDIILGPSSVLSRRNDQSMARLFLCKQKTLSDFQIAQLAWGKEITAFLTPTFYMRMNGVADIIDSGTENSVVTYDAVTNGVEPSFGFSSIPTAPTIQNKPSIIGSPVVGQAVGYQESPATGNPSPAISQQWYLNGVAISNADQEAYTPVASDAGKLLTVRQIAENGVAPIAVRESDPVLVSNVEVSLAPTEQLDDSIIQHVNGVGAVSVEALFTGPVPAKLEYQLYDADGVTITKQWADTGLGAAAGKFSGNVLMPTHIRKNRIAYRTKDGAGNVMVTSPIMFSKFGIGGIVLGTGSSSMAAWFSDGSGANKTVDHNIVSTGRSDPGWMKFDTVGEAGQMAMYWATELGYPIAFINLGLGGTTLTQWANKADIFTRVTNWIAFVKGSIQGVISTCGSNDITGTGAARTVDAHATLLRTFAANCREEANYPTMPFMISGINLRLQTTDERANNARKAEAIVGLESNNLHVQTMQFELGGDGVHLTGAGYIPCTRLVRYVWLERIKKGITLHGPTIKSLRFAGDKVNVEIQYYSGNDFTPLTNIGGFVVVDEKTPGVFTAVTHTATRTNAGNILLSCDQVLVKPKVTYMAGMNPVYPNQVFDNTPFPLAMIAEPFMETVAGAIETPKVLVPYYREFTFRRAILGDGTTPEPDPDPEVPPTTGSFTTYQMVSSGTLRANQQFKATWYKSGEVGASVGTGYIVTGMTDAQGRAVLANLPLGLGFVLVSFAAGGIFYQKGTVA